MGALRLHVLTRSAYGPDWDIEANQRRLAVTRAVTAATLRAQTDRDWALHVLIHAEDPFRSERIALYESVGVPLRVLFTDARGTPQEVAMKGYRAPWRAGIGRGLVAMMRLDDDDGLTPDALARLRPVAAKAKARMALIFPSGIRVWAGRYTAVRHASNAMQTLVTPIGDAATVYDYLHRKVRKHAFVRFVDRNPAWLWYRHPDTISGWRMAFQPVDDYVRGLFPIDWSVVGEPTGRPERAGVAFR
jgi:hypothetical protein